MNGGGSVEVLSPFISSLNRHLPNLPDAPSSIYVSPAVPTAPISHPLAESTPMATVVSPSRIASPTRNGSDGIMESTSPRSENRVVSLPPGAASPRAMYDDVFARMQAASGPSYSTPAPLQEARGMWHERGWSSDGSSSPRHYRSTSSGSSSSPTSDVYIPMGNVRGLHRIQSDASGGSGSTRRQVGRDPDIPLSPLERASLSDRDIPMEYGDFNHIPNGVADNVQGEIGQPIDHERWRILRKVLRVIWKLSLVIVCVIAWLVWSAVCSSAIMTGYCIAGCCQNMARHRQGGCHDLPLMCDGIERSLAWSLWGCRLIWEAVRGQILTPNRQRAHQGNRRRNIVTPPPRLFPNPTRNRYFDVFAAAFDGVVEGLNEGLDRFEDGIERAAVAAFLGPDPRSRRDDPWF